MILLGTKKLHRLILAAYMVIAIIGAFTISLLEPFQNTQLREGKPISSSSFTSINYDFLAETIMLTGNGKGSSSPLRGGFLRTVMPAVMYDGNALSFQYFIKNNESSPHPRIKNAILLKLRI